MFPVMRSEPKQNFLWFDTDQAAYEIEQRRCNGVIPYQEDATIRQVPYKMNDLYLVSENTRRIFFNERIVRFGELVFGNHLVGCNSLTFERGSQQPAHIDHVYMTPTFARRLIAAWVACEDVTPDAGPLL